MFSFMTTRYAKGVGLVKFFSSRTSVAREIAPPAISHLQNCGAAHAYNDIFVQKLARKRLKAKIRINIIHCIRPKHEQEAKLL